MEGASGELAALWSNHVYSSSYVFIKKNIKIGSDVFKCFE